MASNRLSTSAMVWGINYEGGKIIKHALKSKFCKHYANVQIGMDAPFFGEIANETVRTKGRTEKQLTGYNEDQLIQSIKNLFDIIVKIIGTDTSIKHWIIQVARGRAAQSMINEVIRPIFNNYSPQIFEMVTFVHGYKESNYFDLNSINYNFVFINIGMFARLSHESKIGDVCVPVMSMDLKKTNNMSIFREPTNMSNLTDKNRLDVSCWNLHENDLGMTVGYIPMILAGLPDNADFVVPEIYAESDILNLFMTNQT